MKEEIKQFKKENGNVNYTVKELVGALHTKFDKMKTEMGVIATQQATNKARINSIVKVLTIGTPLLVMILAYIISRGSI